ncbi:uncharacterized protein LOC106156474 isoform X1 [Lingula anatina]|uniref:Uncharacterized protein LOC106156474 isoform X1 n=1 Tax=Lingula anatina TaxID=7574 RepID=A0A1S3HNT3_LINAN|nr:uncharacterized protein LOC106156474 isoform X1 [Lingula anatina]|eukprot:XP_013387191.1 uncharacterized protein LOC106156474 isoform X1 [Lingula anatina]
MVFHLMIVGLCLVSMATNIYCGRRDAKKPPPTAMEIGTLLYNIIDSNKDGMIGKLEWAAFLDAADTDHNDEVTASEYVRYFMKASSVLKITWIHALFQLGDFSNDGVLTMADIDQIVSLDIDGDGFVSDEECIEACAMILKKYDPELE